MRILVACEFSGAVRDAFRAKGHDAWSCDLLDSDVPASGLGHLYHLKGDVRRVLGGNIPRDMVADSAWRPTPLARKWDMMIAFPPCTYVCSSGLHWNRRRPERQALTNEALDFVRLLLGADIPRIALENPIGCISTAIRKPDQIIQPWQFGHDASKATCLWLKGLPLLVPTDVLPGGKLARRANQTASGQNKLAPSPDRWKLRSITYPGIAAAMADQWGSLRSPSHTSHEDTTR